jgi:Fe-S oxidoreductase
MLFNQVNCKRCGTCLIECPYIEIGKDQAIEEIKKMIQNGKKPESLNKCIRCGYCNTLCPTNSNPSKLFFEQFYKETKKKGTPGFYIPSEEIPENMVSLALELKSDIYKEKLDRYQNPKEAETMFYLGCGLSYVQTHLISTKLLDEYPKIGGIRYCCGSYTKPFGRKEYINKGKELLNKFNRLNIKKLIVFCPGCLNTLDEYSKLIPEFEKKINLQTFSNYMVEKFNRGELTIKNKVNGKISFHDPCAWRYCKEEVFSGPRELLKILGYELVEMDNIKRKTFCCVASLADSDPERYDRIIHDRLLEAKSKDVRNITVSCTGCLSLGAPAQKEDMKVYHILELVQKSIGEEIPHKTIELRSNFQRLVKNKIQNEPELLEKRYEIRDGKLKRI